MTNKDVLAHIAFLTSTFLHFYIFFDIPIFFPSSVLYKLSKCVLSFTTSFYAAFNTPLAILAAEIDDMTPVARVEEYSVALAAGPVYFPTQKINENQKNCVLVFSLYF